MIRGLSHRLIGLANEEETDGVQALGLAQEVLLGTYFLDLTCVKGPIHFPVDWVLLRDGVRTLVKAMHLIRREGLKHRMAEPGHFLKAINRQSMAMKQEHERIIGERESTGSDGSGKRDLPSKPTTVK